TISKRDWSSDVCSSDLAKFTFVILLNVRYDSNSKKFREQLSKKLKKGIYYKMRKTLLTISVLLLLTIVTACGSGNNAEEEEVEEIDKLVFADEGWDRIRFNKSVAKTIVENGYDYDTDVISGSTATTIQGLREGDIQIYTEIWTDNIKEVYEEAMDAGDIERLSTNFDDNDQGLYVPAYVVEGDPERDIEPLAPDLKTV